MKTKLYFMTLLAMVTVVFYGCYEVPNNFPKAEFYSYAPYHENDKVLFCSNGDTITYVITGVREHYNRGKTTCACGKESVNKEVTFYRSNSEKGFPNFDIYLFCIDRAYFSVTLQSHTEPYTLNADYSLEYTNEDPWAISFDETKIFKEFLDEITLLKGDKPTAKIKKGKGLLWFVDAEGRTWTAE